MNEIQKENLRAWIAALRSGEYNQGSGSLWQAKGDCYCCLGVACQLQGIPRDDTREAYFPQTGKSPWKGTPDTTWFSEKFGFNISRHFPATNAYQKWSMRATEGLIPLNDSGLVSFADIADILENEFLK